MTIFTEQMKAWQGKFGKDYTNRNIMSLEEMESNWKEKCGVTRTEVNKRFLGKINRSLRILEVGSNIGNQLLCLQEMNFKNLYSIELQSFAVELFKSRTRGIRIIQGSAFNIPFKNNSFDLVFTSGLLIHIAPSDISKVLNEIYRCTSKYIWGSEYYSDKYEEINYRGKTNLLWKANFVYLYFSQFDDLSLINEKKYKHPGSKDCTSVFLLEKQG